MNEKIKQICQQKADYWMNHYDRKSKSDMSLLYTDIEKFAELIVRECANIANANASIDPTESHLPGDDIKEHFGVEE